MQTVGLGWMGFVHVLVSVPNQEPRLGNLPGFFDSPDGLMDSPHDVTQLLCAWGAGDKAALDQLTPLVYQELHKSARRCMAHERTGHTLQTTALINEVYLRLVDIKKVSWQNRLHFFAVCSRLMRHILIDLARSRQYLKRGGPNHKIPLDGLPIGVLERPIDLVNLDQALSKLSEIDGRKSQVVELRYFGGLTVKETAEVLKISVETVARDWSFARAWLFRELSGVAR